MPYFVQYYIDLNLDAIFFEYGFLMCFQQNFIDKLRNFSWGLFLKVKTSQ